MGRPRKYNLPDYESFLLDTGRTNRTMARIYVQQVAKLLAHMGSTANDPAEDDVRAAVQAVGAHERRTRAAWNAYADMAQKRHGHRLPVLTVTPRTPRLTERQAGMVRAVEFFLWHTCASLRELATLDVSNVMLYRGGRVAEPYVNAGVGLVRSLGVDLVLPSPSRECCFVLDVPDDRNALPHIISEQWDLAYELKRRDLPLFPIASADDVIPTWDDWCGFAAAAGLSPRVPTDQPKMGTCNWKVTPTARDTSFYGWLQDPTQSWDTLQQNIYG